MIGSKGFRLSGQVPASAVGGHRGAACEPARRRIAIVALLVLAAFALVLAGGCATQDAAADDLMEGIEPSASAVAAREDAAISSLSDAQAAAVADFSVRLFQEELEVGQGGDNPFVSPLSALYALGIVANGAAGETLTQMEAVFGVTSDELNECLRAFGANAEAYDDPALALANSIWLKDDDGLAVERAFLQTNADYYDAAAYKVPFDEGAVRDINAWVEGATDGMIADLVDEIPLDAAMYLVNAVAFEASWASPYEDAQVGDGEFTTESGAVQQVEMMASTEGSYFEDGGAVGFAKPYANGPYAFAALLPPEGASVREYVGTLTGERLLGILAGTGEAVRVRAEMPKFDVSYKTEFSAALKAMGVVDAFASDGTADFSRLGSYDGSALCISRVIHEACVSVDELGTEAAAATAVEMMATSAFGPAEELREVTVRLDRPFVYLIVDTRANIPVFMGIMESVEG